MYNYFKEEARTYEELKSKVNRKYGKNATIMFVRNEKKKSFLGLVTKEVVVGDGYFSKTTANNDFYPRNLDIEKEKEKILNNAKNDNMLKDILNKVNDIENKIEKKSADSTPVEKEVFKEIKNLLMENDFSYDYIEYICDKIEDEIPVGKLDDFVFVKSKVFEWISDTIKIADPDTSSRLDTRPRIIVLVGPTGVGKTTTLTKIGVIYKFDGTGKNIKIITMDNYRVGAKEQMEKYADALEVPFASVETADELRKQILIDQGYDIILIDTIGKSPKDFRKLAEIQDILSGCPGKPEVSLAMHAGLKTADMLEIAAQFSPFKYESIVITKLDETSRAGNIISAIHKLNTGISYITDGQDVSRDIEKATKRKFLINLVGFNE